jgi:16S rRNA (guanine(966)-N(2))-methyltransferase RsmD
MRIISGSARGKQLAGFNGKEIRPTPDRVREALFSILTSRLGNFAGIRVLELFAGSGAQSLEALSRGAEKAVLIDSDKIAAQLIRENVSRCHFEDRVNFIAGDVFKSLSSAKSHGPFSLILLDPPYNKNLIPQALKAIEDLNLLNENGIICTESSKQEILEYDGAFSLLDDRIYGLTRIRLFGLTEGRARTDFQTKPDKG